VTWQAPSAEKVFLEVYYVDMPDQGLYPPVPTELYSDLPPEGSLEITLPGYDAYGAAFVLVLDRWDYRERGPTAGRIDIVFTD
jgi:hypothetical protein